MPDADPTRAALHRLAADPRIVLAVDEARDAATRLRWHPALRRRIPEAAAESRVRGASASALLEGAEVAGSQQSTAVVRDLMRGARPWPEQPDPLWRVLRGAVQVTAATEDVGAAGLVSGPQLLARLHVAAGTPLLEAPRVGRPRVGAETCSEWSVLGPAPDADVAVRRLGEVAALMALVARGQTPVLVAAAIVHAELVASRPFALGNGLVARAAERVLLRVGGLDPTGVLVTEDGHTEGAGSSYRSAVTSYVDGGPDGVVAWVLHCADAVQRGAEQGHAVADAVLAGRVDVPTGLPSGPAKE